MEQHLEIPSFTVEDRIAKLARIGATEEDIAAEMQIPLGRLQKRYRRLLERSKAMGKNQMLGQLYDIAISQSNITTILFWVKAQCGWRDTGPAPMNAQVFRPIFKIVREKSRPA